MNKKREIIAMNFSYSLLADKIIHLKQLQVMPKMSE